MVLSYIAKQGYFDNINHEKLMKLAEQRISDKRIIKLIRHWLRAGFVKDDQFHVWEKKFTEVGVRNGIVDTFRARREKPSWRLNALAS